MRVHTRGGHEAEGDVQLRYVQVLDVYFLLHQPLAAASSEHHEVGLMRPPHPAVGWLKIRACSIHRTCGASSKQEQPAEART